MQVMTLNIWGGHVYEPLLEFIKQQQHKDLQVEHFSVLPDEVSDHAPLLLKIYGEKT